MGEVNDLKGQKFGMLTVIELDCMPNEDKGRRTRWVCRCDCGNYTVVPSANLKSGNTKSCGCLQKEATKRINYKHGMRRTRLYRTWLNMRNRCNNANADDYAHYGGRGISICKEWDDFSMFANWAKENGYEDNLEIDRVDNDGNYCPENCRWATRKRQNNNKRSNRFITCNGETHTLTEWSEISGIKVMTLWHRLEKGWTPEKALNTPVKR